jgi:hypothetical protein
VAEARTQRGAALEGARRPGHARPPRGARPKASGDRAPSAVAEPVAERVVTR